MLSLTAFPNIITNGTTSFTTKPSIKQAIINYFKKVSLNKDHEANTFVNKFYTHHQSEPVSDTKNNQAPEAIDTEELNKQSNTNKTSKKEDLTRQLMNVSRTYLSTC